MNYVLRRTVLQLAVVAACAVAALLVLSSIYSQGASAEEVGAPTISNIDTSVSENSAVITWTTNQGATSQVTYGTTTFYGAVSTLDATNVTSHSVTLLGLASSTLYNFQIISSSGTNATATSSNQTFTTASTSVSGAPVISDIFATPTANNATIIWTTNEPASSQVLYGTSTSYGNETTLDTSLMTGHSVLVSGLTPSTLYHFSVRSKDIADNTATSSDFWFMTTAVSTSTGTSTDIIAILTRLTNLENRVGILEGFVQDIFDWIDGHEDNGTSTPPTGGNALIDQDGQSVRAGTNIDFGGHNFGSEEHIKVTLSGSQVATAFTNLAGGFSTGSVTVPSTTGTYTYTFTGLNSGIIRTATITVIP